MITCSVRSVVLFLLVLHHLQFYLTLDPQTHLLVGILALLLLIHAQDGSVQLFLGRGCLGGIVGAGCRQVQLGWPRGRSSDATDDAGGGEAWPGHHGCAGSHLRTEARCCLPIHDGGKLGNEEGSICRRGRDANGSGGGSNGCGRRSRSASGDSSTERGADGRGTSASGSRYNTPCSTLLGGDLLSAFQFLLEALVLLLELLVLGRQLIDCRLQFFEDDLLAPPRTAGGHLVLLQALLPLELVGIQTRSRSLADRVLDLFHGNAQRRLDDGRKDGCNRSGVMNLLGMALKIVDGLGEFAIAVEGTFA